MKFTTVCQKISSVNAQLRWRVERNTVRSFVYALAVLLGFETQAAAVTPSVTASQAHGLMLNASGSFCAVGQNENGELGDGTAVNRSTPVMAALAGAAVSISSGWYHGLAARSDGTVWA